MIAAVAPIRRLPKDLAFFSYNVPEELVGVISRGQLVRIPFQAGEVFGIVLSTEEETPREKLKFVTSIVSEVPLLPPDHVTYLETITKLYRTPLGAILKMALLPLQKRKLQTATFVSTKKKKPIRQEEHFLLWTSEAEHKELLVRETKKKTCIVVPTIEHGRKMLDLLENKTAVLWSSDLSDKEKFIAWSTIRNGEADIIVGTRSVLFLPLVDIDTIIVDYEHDENHKHWDQSPRFHAKDLARIYGKQTGTRVITMSCSPSVESYFLVKKKIVAGTDFVLPKRKPTIVDMREEKKAKNYGVLGDAVEAALQQSTGDIFLYLNRLGYASSIGCRGCGYVATCDACHLPYPYHEGDHALTCKYCKTSVSIPPSCPSCGKAMLNLRGAGTELIESTIRKLLRNGVKHQIIRVDSDSTTVPSDETSPRCLIGTKKATPLVRWDKTDTVIMVNIDTELHISEYTTDEEVWHTIAEFETYKNEDCRLFIQTHTPEHLVVRSLSEPERFYRMDLNSRMAFEYPPYTYLTRFLYAGQSIPQTEQTVAQVHKILGEQLTKGVLRGILGNPYLMEPVRHRTSYWGGFTLKLPRESWEADLERWNAIIPSGWRVDPRPLSILGHS